MTTVRVAPYKLGIDSSKDVKHSGRLASKLTYHWFDYLAFFYQERYLTSPGTNTIHPISP